MGRRESSHRAGLVGAVSGACAVAALILGIGPASPGSQQESWLSEGAAAFIAPYTPGAPRLSAPSGARPLRSATIQAAGLTSTVGSWVLPSVDKDTGDWRQGMSENYAWVQTGQTIYVFVLLRAEEVEHEAAKVELAVREEGTHVILKVMDLEVLNGKLSNAVKPGDEIWMIEDGPDGREYVVVELEKLVKGREWSSLMMPKVTFVGDVSEAVVTPASVSQEQIEATVEATLDHLRKQQGTKRVASEDHAAVVGDVLTLDMRGFELTAEGGRGAPMDVGAATDMKVELGAKGGLPPKVHEALVGVKTGESRDVQVGLGKRAGGLEGQSVVLEVTCKQIEEETLAELNDEFAKDLKRKEQMIQAASENGIPEEEEGLAERFTLQDLRNEITTEVSQAAYKEEFSNFNAQLKAVLARNVKVQCDWGDSGGDPQWISNEETAAAMAAVAATKPVKKVDDEEVRKVSWDELGEPNPKTGVAEVGDDPDRDFQRVYLKHLRKAQEEVVLEWLAEQVKVEEGAAA